jgi:hypothetical protein
VLLVQADKLLLKVLARALALRGQVGVRPLVRRQCRGSACGGKAGSQCKHASLMGPGLCKYY